MEKAMFNPGQIGKTDKRSCTALIMFAITLAICPAFAESASDDDAKAKAASDALIYNNRGLERQRNGDLKGAMEDYNKALTLLPGLARAYNNRGLCYWTQNDSQRALKDFEQAVKLSPTDPVTYNNIGMVHRKQGNYNEAIKDFTHAIELDAKLAVAYDNRGLCKSSLKDYKELSLS